MAPIDLLNKELPETFQFVKGKKKKKKKYLSAKCNKAKCNKKSDACNGMETILKSETKQKWNVYACQDFRR